MNMIVEVSRDYDEYPTIEVVSNRFRLSVKVLENEFCTVALLRVGDKVRGDYWVSKNGPLHRFFKFVTRNA